MVEGVDRRTRTIRNLVEPVAGVAFFAVEVHDRYEALGFANPDGELDGVRRFDWPAYFAARAACLGPVSGRSAAAAFGVFPVNRVATAVDDAFARTEPAALLRARLEGTTLALHRLLATDRRFDHDELRVATELLDQGLASVETQAAAHPLFSGLRALPVPDDPLGWWWRLCDQYREHRMDVHVAAMTAAELDGCQACILNDLRQGLGLGSYVVTRGWTSEEIDRSIEALRRRGLVSSTGLTEEGQRFRERLEAATDRGQSPIVERMGGEGPLRRFEACIGWHRQAIVDGYGYPGRRFVEQASRKQDRI